jgi:hypothetical protein
MLRLFSDIVIFLGSYGLRVKPTARGFGCWSPEDLVQLAACSSLFFPGIDANSFNKKH